MREFVENTRTVMQMVRSDRGANTHERVRVTCVAL
jgi:hypothetical protein